MRKLAKSFKNAAALAADENANVACVLLPRSLLVAICVLVPVLVMAFAVTAFWLGTRTQRASSTTGVRTYAVPSASRGGDQTEIHRAAPGPWGNLEYQRIFIEIPDEYLSVRLHESDVPRWFFKGHSIVALSQLFEKAGLSSRERTELLNTNHWEVSAAGIGLKPSLETVLSLATESREKIYSVLAQFEQNPAQEQAFHWTADSADDALAGTDISKETLSLVRRLCYHHGKLLMFADLPTVLRTLPNEAEKNRLEKALSRRSTLLVRLYVNPSSDIDSLDRYWGRAGCGKDIRPLLEAAAKVSQGTKLSLLNLLPPWPAARLQTYPFPAPGAQPDCLWTAFNFFKDPPDPPTTDASYWKHKLDTEYYPVASDPRFGDTLMLIRPDGVIIHACTFLADNIVYTKNGANATVPWTLMSLPELLEVYSSEMPASQSLLVKYYRNKNY